MNKTLQIILGALAIIVIAGGAWAYLTQPDDRTVGEHLSDAVNKLDEGVDDAARELEDRTPAERISDEYKDATDGDRN